MRSALLILDQNVMVGEGEQANGIHKVTEEVAPLGHFIPPPNLRPQQALEAAGHAGQRSGTGDRHGHG
jgi:hypothetical protein